MTDSEVMPRLAPRGKIVIPEVFTRRTSTDSTPAPASEKTSLQAANEAQETVVTAEEEHGRAVAANATPAEMVEPTREALKPISPGLSNVSLPLGPKPKGENTAVEKKSVSDLDHVFDFFFVCVSALPRRGRVCSAY